MPPRLNGMGTQPFKGGQIAALGKHLILRDRLGRGLYLAVRQLTKKSTNCLIYHVVFLHL